MLVSVCYEMTTNSTRWRLRLFLFVKKQGKVTLDQQGLEVGPEAVGGEDTRTSRGTQDPHHLSHQVHHFQMIHLTSETA